MRLARLVVFDATGLGVVSLRPAPALAQPVPVPSLPGPFGAAPQPVPTLDLAPGEHRPDRPRAPAQATVPEWLKKVLSPAVFLAWLLELFPGVSGSLDWLASA